MSSINNTATIKNRTQLTDILRQLEIQAKRRFCRFPVIMTGDRNAPSSMIESFLTPHDAKDIIWISEQIPATVENCTHLNANNIIGREYQHIIYDIDSHFEPNLFAALAGTLRGGGLFIILCHNINDAIQRAEKNNLFFCRLLKILSKSTDCIIIEANREETLHLNKKTIEQSDDHLQSSLPSKQQETAIEGIIHVTKGHRNRPYILLADRGRGKSAALGIAASRLLSHGLKKILLTAPSLTACNIIFKHLSLNLPSATMSKGRVIIGDCELAFISPDELVRAQPKTDLLIVDEAAGIPAPMLETMLQQYSRIVFATTLHGYEGSGQYFSIKFFKKLNEGSPGWKKNTLTAPIRWNENDPLEKLVNRLFLLKPLSEPTKTLSKALDACTTIEKVTANTLINHEQRLSQLYALLSSAHYKTQPSDLQNILNEPNIHIFLSIVNDQIIAAAFAIEEGGINAELEHEIFLGNRRIKGHIIPQTLSLHLGLVDIAQYHYLRIMRIAVLPQYQSKGYGSSLVNHIIQFAKKESFDVIGCTFASTNELIHFWGKQQLTIVRLGSHRKANAPGFSALMLRALNSSASAIHDAAHQHFHENFAFQLKETHKQLDHTIVTAILKNTMKTGISGDKKPSAKEIKNLTAFAQGNRQLDDNLAAMNKLTYYALSQKTTYQNLITSQLAILIVKILQQQNWQDTVKALNLSGKKNGNCELKKATLILLKTLDLIT